MIVNDSIDLFDCPLPSNITEQHNIVSQIGTVSATDNTAAASTIASSSSSSSSSSTNYNHMSRIDGSNVGDRQIEGNQLNHDDLIAAAESGSITLAEHDIIVTVEGMKIRCLLPINYKCSNPLLLLLFYNFLFHFL